MDWLDWFYKIGTLACLLAIGYVAYVTSTPEFKTRQAAYEYARNYPCINGVRYIRSTGKSDSLTPMIDPETMQPQLCGAEKNQ